MGTSCIRLAQVLPFSVIFVGVSFSFKPHNFQLEVVERYGPVGFCNLIESGKEKPTDIRRFNKKNNLKSTIEETSPRLFLFTASTLFLFCAEVKFLILDGFPLSKEPSFLAAGQKKPPIFPFAAKPKQTIDWNNNFVGS